ncbi:Ultraviolet-B receptor UVR8 [Camellia lanceoleosa]|uniref:Ultraviolet-B receptor UVR8 n=1 Tax=Camellia lanceoleosa TaxID=1840588 RepID=A0ACC0HQR7_9ERIC|nr:Ultraviolet-B receptor UVR8 [Camellia lanceoleosa]
MNGTGSEEEGVKMEDTNETVVLMLGYLPGASQDRSKLLSRETVQFPATNIAGDSWKDVCGGGCGFAMAISENRKPITWESADDQGQSYLTSGKHDETPEPFPLPTEAPMMKTAVGWAHCVSTGEVYTWGWEECIPSGKIVCDFSSGGSFEKEPFGKQSSILSEQAISETLSAPPCLVDLNPGVRITSVAAGGRHTLALSGKSTFSWILTLEKDSFQNHGWGYGGNGQIGLGSRIKMVSSPLLIPCIEPSSFEKDTSSVVHQGITNLTIKAPGTYIKGIACGGRHMWARNTNDVLGPPCVSSLLGTQIEGIAAGLWHIICISVEGRLHDFGGNQFSKLGTGTDQSENLPKLLDDPSLENKRAKIISCGARYSAILTEDGRVHCWGWNKYGQLGLGDSIDRNVPSQVPIEGCLPKSLACGWWHTLLLAQIPF